MPMMTSRIPSISTSHHGGSFTFANKKFVALKPSSEVDMMILSFEEFIIALGLCWDRRIRLLNR
jgi:hypothetical protein